MIRIKHFISERIKLKSEIYDESVPFLTYFKDKLIHSISILSVKLTELFRQRFGRVDNRAEGRTAQEGGGA
jgi:hypothetical protein